MSRRLVGVAAFTAAIAVLVAFAWQPLTRLAAGFDETAHIAGAHALLRTGSNRLNIEHPPLVKHLAGIGMAVTGQPHEPPPAPIAANEWDYGQWLLFRADRPDDDLLHAARLPFLLVACLGALGVFLYARLLFGVAAGWFSLWLYVLAPVIHAHAALVLTDLSIAVSALWTSLACEYGRRRARWGFWVLAGAAAACAAFAKATGLLVIVIALCVAGIAAVDGKRRTAVPIAATLGGFIAGLFIANGFSFQFGEYLLSLSAVGFNQHRDYLHLAAGQYASGGFWWYIPYTLLLKSTIAELVALASALAATVVFARRVITLPRAEQRERLFAIVLLLAVPGAYLLGMALFAPSIGHRYALLAYPYLFVWAGIAATLLTTHRSRMALVVIVALQLGAAVKASPDPLTYFNGLLGCRGPDASLCLDDSSIDYGQSISLVADALPESMRDKPLYVLYHGSASVPAYLPDARPMTRALFDQPEPGVYVLSAHQIARLRGHAPGVIRSPLYRALRNDRAIGNSYYLVEWPPKT